MIEFKECQKEGYAARTIENASADVTIAFAMDFSTPGERLTKKTVLEQKKIYVPIDVSNTTNDFTDLHRERSNLIVDALKNVKTLNIAGNGLYTLVNYGFINQEDVDRCCMLYLKWSIERLRHLGKFNLELIRSGGQSGFDEAGLKCAEKMGIPALCLAPKGWKFINEKGISYEDETLFKNRFK